MDLIPQQLLPWHTVQWAQMTRQFQENRMPHALMFTGPVGVGKVAFSRRLANYLLCENAKTTTEPCGDCPSCQLFSAGTHPDYRQIEVEPGAKIIKIEQIRELNESVTLTSSYRGFKVELLVDADLMNSNAANALLKTLEEPPAGTCLILLATQPSRLPATIRSRTQQLLFPLPPFDQAEAYLSQHYRASEVKERLLLGMGAPLAPLPKEIDAHWKEHNTLFDSFERLLLSGKKVVEEAQLWTKSPSSERFEWLTFWLADLIRLKLGASDAQLLNPDLKKRLLRLAESRKIVELFNYFDRLNEMKRALVQNANMTLSLESLFVQMIAPNLFR